MESTKIRFGILGAANIARKNARSILLSENCELIGQLLFKTVTLVEVTLHDVIQ